MASKKTFRVYFITHSDDRLSGILLRRWESFFDTPWPAAYGSDEEEVLRHLEIQLQEREIEEEEITRYLWDETFEVGHVRIDIHPQTMVNKIPVIGKKRIPLVLTYAACRQKSGYRVILPRFEWWMQVEALDLAADMLKHSISGALLGEKPQWLYEFRREGEEYIRTWDPAFLKRSTVRDEITDEFDEEEFFPVMNSVAEELVRKAGLRQLPRVVGDDPDMGKYFSLFQGYPPPSVLLIGDSGVGKSTWIRRLARVFFQWRKNDQIENVPRIWRTSGERIIAGMVYLGMWQKRCFDMIEELGHEGDYLYIERLSSIMRIQADGGSVAELLTPSVISGEISLMSECSEAELEHYRRQVPNLINAFEMIRIPECSPTRMPSLTIQYQAIQNPLTTIHPDALIHLIRYLDTFQKSIRFPGKGFHFIDWLNKQKDLKSKSVCYTQDITQAFSRYTGLPVQLIADHAMLSVEDIANTLKQHIIGQDHVCKACAQMLARFKARINDPDRPVSTLLFVGPTGVGKTEMAKQLARYMYSDEKRLVRLDMSEYMTSASVYRLLEAGKSVQSLAEQIREQPMSVLLLDEIEKAHPQVFDLLLGILGEARMTDSLGRLVDFRMVVIIMTSNLGVTETEPIGFDRSGQDNFTHQVRQYFRPEFFNRIDYVIPFRRLSREDILGIVHLELKKAAARAGLQQRGINLEISDQARQVLARVGFHPTRGARPLKRVIHEMVITPAAVRIASEPDVVNRKLFVHVQSDESEEIALFFERI